MSIWKYRWQENQERRNKMEEYTYSNAEMQEINFTNVFILGQGGCAPPRSY